MRPWRCSATERSGRLPALESQFGASGLQRPRDCSSCDLVAGGVLALFRPERVQAGELSIGVSAGATLLFRALNSFDGGSKEKIDQRLEPSGSTGGSLQLLCHRGFDHVK